MTSFLKIDGYVLSNSELNDVIERMQEAYAKARGSYSHRLADKITELKAERDNRDAIAAAVPVTAIHMARFNETDTFHVGIRIPSTHRDSFRKLIRSNPGYEGWRTAPDGANGLETREIRKHLEMQAVVYLGLEQEVMTLLNTPADQLESVDPEVRDGDPEVASEAPASEVPAALAPESAPLSGKPVLDAISPYVSGMVLDLAKEALASIINAANAKPKVIEIEKVVYETLAPGQAVPALPLARIQETSTLGKVFGFRGSESSVPVPLWDALNVPEVSPLYVPDPETLADFVTAVNRGTYVWFAGPSGTGKSTLPEQFAARTRRPFVCIALHRATETPELVGMDKLANGNMVWTDGVLAQAIRRPGTIILLDEITFCPPGIAAKLQGLLSSRALTIDATGEVVRCAKGVYFCAADNTRGYGDETGMYAGTMQANAALVNRFGRMIVVDYMDSDKETRALVNMTGAPRAACEEVTSFVAYARKLPGFSGVPLSLRNMKGFVDSVIDGRPIDRAFAMSFLNMLPDAEREALRQAFRSQFNQTTFNNGMSGKTPVSASPVSNAPEQVNARNAFPEVNTNS